MIRVGAAISLTTDPGVFDPIGQGSVAEHLAEFAVIVALAGLGLSIDPPISWRGWMTTGRMLAVVMPLTIAAAALLG